MKEFNANRKSVLIKGRIWISCIALLLALAVILYQYASSDIPTLSTKTDGTEVSGTTLCSASTENETETTAVSEPNQTEASEPSTPNTETAESVTTDPAPSEPEETAPTVIIVSTEPPHSHSYISTVVNINNPHMLVY